MGTLTITNISLKDHRFAQVLTHTYENKSQELKKQNQIKLPQLSEEVDI